MIFHLIAFLSDESIRILPLNITMIVLIPVVIFFTLRLLKNHLANYIGGTKQQHSKAQNAVVMFSILGGLIGIIAARYFLYSVTPSGIEIILSIFVGVIILLSVFSATIAYYDVYLIRKHCPRLRDRQTRL